MKVISNKRVRIVLPELPVISRVEEFETIHNNMILYIIYIRRPAIYNWIK